MIAAPPLKAGAVKVMVARASPAVAVPMVGALGATAVTVKDWITVDAANQAEAPG